MATQDPPQTRAGEPAQTGERTLRGSLGVAGIVFMVVAASSPLTVIAGAAPIALAIGNGAGLPLTYVFIAVVLLLFSVGYSLMSRNITNAGAFYAYVTRGLGRPPGLGAAFLALVSYTAIQAAVYGLFGAVLSGLIVRFGGPTIPWWVCAFAGLVVVALLGYRNVDLNARVLGFLLICEVGIIAAMDIAVLITGGAAGISGTAFTLDAFFSGSAGIAVMFAVASFVGFEATAIYGEEARNPRRTVPIATYVAVAFLGGFYAFSTWSIVVAYGPAQIASVAAEKGSGLTFATAGAYLGPVAADTMNVLLVTSLLAVLLAFHNAIARYFFALGRERVLPHALGRSHTAHGSPYVGSLTQTACAFVIVGIFALLRLDPVRELFTWLSGVAALGILGLMILTCIAVLVFFYRTGVDRRLWNTIVAPGLGLIGLLIALVLLLRNFTTLLGGAAALALAFEILLAAVFVLGIALAVWWRQSNPQRYSAMGSFLG